MIGTVLIEHHCPFCGLHWYQPLIRTNRSVLAEMILCPHCQAEAKPKQPVKPLEQLFPSNARREP